MTIGQAWSVVDDDGNHGYAVRLHAVPTASDGNFFLSHQRATSTTAAFRDLCGGASLVVEPSGVGLVGSSPG